MALLVLSLSAPLCISGCGGGGESTPSRTDLENTLKKGIKPNELGMVMVLEYHRIEEKEGDYTRSIENFKRDLETLYEKGYRLVKFRDLMSGRIDVPEGTTPVVFSFDDSTEGQFRYLKEGGKVVIDPDCAVGMMNAFYQKHKDFGYTGLFNFLPGLFDQPKYVEKKVDYLQENGFEFGNHTTNHPALGRVTDDVVKEEIAGPVEEMKNINPKVKMDILCLPHGSEPKSRQLMFEGSYDGTSYLNKWALLVGSNPFYPVYHYKNSGKVIPRIQVMDYDPEDGSGASGSGYWLRYFDKHPELRYLSDGNPETVCAPEYMEPRVLEKRLPNGVSFMGY